MSSIAPIHRFDDSTWGDGGPSRCLEPLIEGGAVLHFARLTFALQPGESRFLDPGWADGRAKNISLRGTNGKLRGALGDPAGRLALTAMLERFAKVSEALALRLFPFYRGALRRGNTSLRPVRVEARATSLRRDDTRLHVDAFPSNPMRGTRLLRVFCNVNPHGEARCWRIGESFEAHASRFLPSIARPLPGSSWLLRQLRITKRRRSEYDHVMLQLHDRAKADFDFQRSAPQSSVDFAPGATWVVFSDQVPHAATSGQHLLEQTFYLEVEQMQHPEASPLRTLERLLGRALR